MPELLFIVALVLVAIAWVFTAWQWAQVRTKQVESKKDSLTALKKEIVELRVLCESTIVACNNATDAAVKAHAKAEEALQRVGRLDVATTLAAASRGTFGG